MPMLLTLESIGSIRKSINKTEILIYSEYEHVVSNMMQNFGPGSEKGQKILVVSKNNSDKNQKHQVKIMEATLLERNGNVLTIEKSDIQEGPVIDVKSVLAI